MSDRSAADDSSRDGAKARRPAPPSCAPPSIPRVWFTAFDVFKSFQGPGQGEDRGRRWANRCTPGCPKGPARARSSADLAFDVFKLFQGPKKKADLVVREDSDEPASETEGVLQWAGCSSAARRSQGMNEAIGRAAQAKLR